jgi:hypothetical protein
MYRQNHAWMCALRFQDHAGQNLVTFAIIGPFFALPIHRNTLADCRHADSFMIVYYELQRQAFTGDQNNMRPLSIIAQATQNMTMPCNSCNVFHLEQQKTTGQCFSCKL